MKNSKGRWSPGVHSYWGIETRQHYRYDHSRRKDRCQVRQSTATHYLALIRSLAIFLYECQRGDHHRHRSLPDWQRRSNRQPSPLLDPLATATV